MILVYKFLYPESAGPAKKLRQPSPASNPSAFVTISSCATIRKISSNPCFPGVSSFNSSVKSLSFGVSTNGALSHVFWPLLLDKAPCFSPIFLTCFLSQSKQTVCALHESHNQLPRSPLDLFRLKLP